MLRSSFSGINRAPGLIIPGSRRALKVINAIIMPKRILAFVAGSDRTLRVLDYVIGYAASVGPVETVVLSVHSKSAVGVAESLSTTQSEQIIKRATRRLKNLGIVYKSRVEAGDPACAIARCAKEERCDMIIVNDSNPMYSVREPSKVWRQCQRSIIRQVSRLIPIPVVIVG